MVARLAPLKPVKSSYNFLIFASLKADRLKVSREIKIGGITLLALFGLYYGINFLKGQDFFENKRIFYAVYTKIDELTKARPVNINGYRVGQVHEINFHPDGSGRLVVSLNITNDIAIPKNTVARIYSSDLIGSKAVELVMGDSQEWAETGDTLRSTIELSLTDEVNEQVKPIKEKAEKLIGSIDTVMVLASGFLNEDTKSNFTETFANLRNTFEKLNNTVNALDRAVSGGDHNLVGSIEDVSKITETIEENRQELDRTFKNIANLSDSLSKVDFKRTLQNLDSTLSNTNEVMAKINEGNGTVGELVNDKELYQNLLKATEQLNLILLDLKYNPSRYVRFSVFGGGEDYDEEEIMKKEAEAAAKRADTANSK